MLRQTSYFKPLNFLALTEERANPAAETKDDDERWAGDVLGKWAYSIHCSTHQHRYVRTYIHTHTAISFLVLVANFVSSGMSGMMNILLEWPRRALSITHSFRTLPLTSRPISSYTFSCTTHTDTDTHTQMHTHTDMHTHMHTHECVQGSVTAHNGTHGLINNSTPRSCIGGQQVSYNN